jgi:hypothetical protein
MAERRREAEQRERLVPAPERASQRRTLGNWLKDGTVPPAIRTRGRLYGRASAVEAL